MSNSRVGILPHEERMAIIQGAQKLGLNPYEFGAFLSLESGPNMDPNIVGGAGGRHRGLIQFGQNEQKLYGISGTQSRAQQMPAVLKYFQDRGFKPGMDIGRAYATVLGGNPNVSLDAKDSFGTSVRGALPRFKKGGDLYANAQRVLGDLPTGFGVTTDAANVAAAPQQKSSKDLAGQDPVLMMMAQKLFEPFLQQTTPASPMNKLTNFMQLFGAMGQ
jgi:hypothetical protein